MHLQASARSEMTKLDVQMCAPGTDPLQKPHPGGCWLCRRAGNPPCLRSTRCSSAPSQHYELQDYTSVCTDDEIGAEYLTTWLQVVPESLRSSIYAFDRCFEGAISALSAPLVGLIAERWFHYTSNFHGSTPRQQLSNASALGDGLLVRAGLTIASLCAIYCFT